MYRNVLIIGSALGFAISLAGADISSSQPRLSTREIADKSVAARGGLEAWRVAFSNSGRVLGRRDRVDVVIGRVQALELVAE